MSENLDEARVEHSFTPALFLTGLRPILGAGVAKKLIQGEKGIGLLIVSAIATDAEGKLARFIDRRFPNSGYGSTELGVSADPIADAVTASEVAAAALIGPRVSKFGKLAAGIALGTEVRRAKWAIEANARYKEQHDRRLVIHPSKVGKIAIALKGVGIGGAAYTNDMEDGFARDAVGLASVGFAIAGSYFGEKARRGYAAELDRAEIDYLVENHNNGRGDRT